MLGRGVEKVNCLPDLEYKAVLTLKVHWSAEAGFYRRGLALADVRWNLIASLIPPTFLSNKKPPSAWAALRGHH